MVHDSGVAKASLGSRNNNTATRAVDLEVLTYIQ